LGKKIIIIILISLPSLMFGQTQMDTSTFQPHEKEWRILVDFDANRSFFSGRPVKINGIRIGAKYRYKHRFGLGLYSLKKGVVFRDIPVEEPDATDTSYTRFDAGFGALFYEYTFFTSKRWELIVPSYIGFGNISVSYTDTTGVYQPLKDKPFSSLGTGIGAQFKIVRWFGVKGAIGYRRIIYGSDPVREAFNGIYYKYGVAIFIGELYKMAFKRETLKPW